MDLPKIIEQRAVQAAGVSSGVAAAVVSPVAVASSAVAPQVAPAGPVGARVAPATPATPATPAAPAPQWNKHIVEAGDTLSKLAQKYKTSIKAIQTLNQLNDTTIKVGDTLKIPTK
jgi:LysM repeat protein